MYSTCGSNFTAFVITAAAVTIDPLVDWTIRGAGVERDKGSI